MSLWNQEIFDSEKKVKRGQLRWNYVREDTIREWSEFSQRDFLFCVHWKLNRKRESVLPTGNGLRALQIKNLERKEVKKEIG